MSTRPKAPHPHGKRAEPAWLRTVKMFGSIVAIVAGASLFAGLFIAGLNAGNLLFVEFIEAWRGA